MSKTGIAALIVSAVLGFGYFGLMSAASNGYGYMGHNGYNRGPSFFYFGAPPIYYGRSVRSGSTSGSSMRGGGPGSGK